VKVVPFDRLGMVLVFYSNFIPKTNFQIFDFKNVVTLKSGSLHIHW